jgi:hypothetical protein
MSIGGGGSSGSSTTQLDPQLKQDWQNLDNQAIATSQGQTPTQTVAGFTPTGILGQNLTLQAAGAGQDQLGQATGDAEAIAGWRPTAVSGDTSQSSPDSGIVSFRDVGPSGLTPGAIAGFQNPYTSSVVNTTLDQLDQQRRRDLNQNGSTATLQGGEGAFGGSRAGVSDALTNESYGRLAAQTAAQLNDQGFQEAGNLASTAAGQNLSAGQSNQAADLTKGQTVYGGTLATDQANQAAINQLGEFNAGQNLDAAQLGLGAAGLLGTLGGQAQSQALTGAGAVTGVGAQQQAQQQAQDTAAYNNAMTRWALPLQTQESAFGIIPSTSNGSSTHSSGKSGNVGIG